MSPARNKRSKGGMAFRLTGRDMGIIQAVNRYRYLRSGQINRLFFPENTSKQSCQKRLKYLFHNGYLDRIFPYVQLGTEEKDASSDVAYRLDKQGVTYLEDSGEEVIFPTRKRRVRHEFLRHALDLSEFRVCLELGLAALPGYQLRLFVPDFLQKEGATGLTGLRRYRLYDEIRDPATGEMVVFYPDAMMVLEATGADARRLYFIEIDRGTEGLQTIRRKMRAYQLYARNRVFAKLGKFQNFTVLFQTSSERRAANMVRLVAEMDSGLQVLVTHAAAVTEKTLLTEPVWSRSEGEPISLIKPQVLLDKS
jgi:hypothetical protein